MSKQLLLVSFGLSVWLLGSAALAQSESNGAFTSAKPPLRLKARHPHFEPHAHPTVLDTARFTTNRSSAVDLPLPQEKDAFTFAVFGDRTGGPPEGVEILRQAVADVNLFEPDLVMTVGDLIQGYNETDAWMAEMAEYKAAMTKLLCPWFPVAGNHDIYYRGSDRPHREHEENYEMHFGPLWYAFEHKNCWFMVLFSDEGNPENGAKSFNTPDCQRMSPEQFEWLKSTLAAARDAEHVFLFLHHPRWLGNNYGDDWNKVHRALVAAGNVRAVFAGHIHRMRYDGPRDGIEYVTLATVGGGQSGISPKAGYLHHYHLVTVRKQQIAMSSVPVGEVMNVREITGRVSSEVEQLAQTPPRFKTRPRISDSGQADQPLVVELFNPTSRPVEYTVQLESTDQRWAASPDHGHQRVYPGQRAKMAFHLRRMEPVIDDAYRPPELIVDLDYLSENARIALTERRVPVPIHIDIPTPDSRLANMAADIGAGNCFRVDNASIDLPDGPMTLECWFKARTFSQRVGLVAKTERSEYGLFVSNGLPYFTIHLGGRYVEPQPEQPLLQVGVWHHVAGVFDGAEVRTYVDGNVVSRGPGRGTRSKNGLPLMIGADVTGRGEATSFFDGELDAVRLSTVPRYTEDNFTPSRTWEPDDETALLLKFDQLLGPFGIDESGRAAHAIKVGNPSLQLVK